MNLSRFENFMTVANYWKNPAVLEKLQPGEHLVSLLPSDYTCLCIWIYLISASLPQVSNLAIHTMCWESSVSYFWLSVYLILCNKSQIFLTNKEIVDHPWVFFSHYAASILINLQKSYITFVQLDCNTIQHFKTIALDTNSWQTTVNE